MTAEAHGPRLDDRTGVAADWQRQVAFVAYDAEGNILQFGHNSAAGIRLLEEVTGRAHLVVSNGTMAGLSDAFVSARYVDVAAGILREKTPCPAVLDGMVLSNLPAPCRIEISQQSHAPTVYPVEETELELAFDHPGRHVVRVLATACLPGEFEVVAP